MILTLTSDSPDPDRIAKYATEHLGYPVDVRNVETVGEDLYTFNVVALHICGLHSDRTRSGGYVVKATCECGWEGFHYGNDAAARDQWSLHVAEATR